MAKKKTFEERVVAEAADLIMQTIHIAAVRIAGRYEELLMDEVVSRIRAGRAAMGEVQGMTGDYINDRLEGLKRREDDNV